jgi:rod shape determining protein RodA
VIDRRLVTNFDWTLIGLVSAICLIGILNVYSASAAYKMGGAPYYIKQLNWMAFGLLLSLVVASIDYHILEDFSYWFYGFLLLLLVAVLLVGKRSLGATRWLESRFFHHSALRADEDRDYCYLCPLL